MNEKIDFSANKKAKIPLNVYNNKVKLSNSQHSTRTKKQTNKRMDYICLIMANRRCDLNFIFYYFNIKYTNKRSVDRYQMKLFQFQPETFLHKINKNKSHRNKLNKQIKCFKKKFL